MSDVDLSALNGDFKQAYQDKIKDLVPNYAYLLKHTSVEKGMKQLGTFIAEFMDFTIERINSMHRLRSNRVVNLLPD